MRLTKPQSRSGAAMVEMAIVLPVLLILTLGLMEYGWVFVKVSQINQCARHGVRTAVRPGVTKPQVEAAVAAMMLSDVGLQPNQYQITTAPTDINVAVGQPITVQINVNYSLLSLTGTGLLPVPNQLQGRGTMVKEGP